jgi:5-methylcytosine-specific restriction endonuclease McrA
MLKYMKFQVFILTSCAIMIATQAGASNTRRVLPSNPRMEVVSVMAESTIPQKKCKGCTEIKPHSAFYMRANGKPRSRCIECFKAEKPAYRELTEEQKEARRVCVRRYYQKNKEKFKARAVKYYQENTEALKAYGRKWQSENKDHFLELARNWRKSHPLSSEQRERYRERQRAWRSSNRERENARNREWGKNNPELRLAINQKQRAKRKGVSGNFTAREWAEIKERYGYKCLCCGRSEPQIKLTIDHIVPISLGGLNVAENIQPLCGSCNSSKWAREIDYRPMFELNKQVEQDS